MSNPLKIMVVDPDHSAVLQMANAFRQQGWETVVAGDAVVAQSVIRKEKPAVIVLSSHLPGGGATLVVRRIRSSVHTVGTPVVVLGKPGGSVGEVLAAGANEYLKPPLNVTELCAKIRGLLSQEQIQPETMPAMAPGAGTAVVGSGSAAAVAMALVPTLNLSPAAAPSPAPAPTPAPAEVIGSAQRLTALAAADVLDSPRSPLLDSITHIAAMTLEVPTALLSIVDQDRQFFKSHFGLPEPWCSKRQTPLSHSFCQWVASAEEELVVDDAREQPALRANLAVQDLGVIAYAGVPVKWTFEGENPTAGQAPGAAVLGSFCAIDSKPRAWSREDMTNLRQLARMAEAGLVLEKAEKTNTQLKIDGITCARAASAIVLNATQLLRRNDGNNAFGIARGLLLQLLEAQAQDLVSCLR